MRELGELCDRAQLRYAKRGRGSLTSKGISMPSDPWTEWRRLVRAGTLVGETLAASHRVVGHRRSTISAAVENPLRADHAELGRMVSEKMAAFGEAGSSLTRDWWAMQADLAAQAAAITGMMLGQAPGPSEARAMLARTKRIGGAMLASSNRAMTPIHRAATANERRLGRTRRR